MKKRMLVSLVAFAVTALFAHQAFAGNTDSYGLDAKAVALGGAVGAQVDNPFGVHYNPAGLVRMKGFTVSAGATLLDAVLDAKGYTVAENTTHGVPQLGPANVTDDSPSLVAPHLGFGMPVNDKISIGLAMYAPFGLKLEWPKNPKYNPGAYNTYESWYERIVATPTIAYKVSDKLSLGLGVALGKSLSGSNYLLSQAKANALADGVEYAILGGIEQQVRQAYPDFTDAQVAAAVNAAATTTYAPTIAGAKSAAQSLANGKIEADLEDNFNYSFNIGVLYRPTENLSLGMTYRSKAETEFEGDIDYIGTSAQNTAFNTVLKALGLNRSATATVKDLDAPDQLQLGVHYWMTPKVGFEMDVVWTNWSCVQYETVEIAPALLGQSLVKTRRSWKDTTQLRFGLEWLATDNVTLRCGYFYDPTPIPDDTFDILWADADKKTYSAGFGFNHGNWTLDGAVQYTITEQDRILGGESEALNESYGGSEVSLAAGGHIWGYSLTLGYQF